MPVKQPAKKAPVASVKVPPLKSPVAKTAVAKAVAKPAPKKAAVKKPKLGAAIAARLKTIFEAFQTGGMKRSAEARGAITVAQKAALDAIAKEQGVTPSALVAAVVTDFLNDVK
ncbi:hypothetical protein D9M68_18370 [compost metagenome]